MEVTIQAVPPGGGEVNFTFLLDVPEIPRAGDYISILRDKDLGSEDFIVLRTRWNVSLASKSGESEVRGIFVDCEYALGPMSSEAHKKACARYGTVKEFADGY